MTKEEEKKDRFPYFAPFLHNGRKWIEPFSEHACDMRRVTAQPQMTSSTLEHRKRLRGRRRKA